MKAISLPFQPIKPFGGFPPLFSFLSIFFLIFCLLATTQPPQSKALILHHCSKAKNTKSMTAKGCTKCRKRKKIHQRESKNGRFQRPVWSSESNSFEQKNNLKFDPKNAANRKNKKTHTKKKKKTKPRHGTSS
ncbi:hypothetical protein QBC44DRAFT_133296 [Cladorrhinum sp. PSN332]|nr:hypothetical protein QBC44DRAFT_133296 [Cladorrhinum sp. PSN332]